MGIHDRHYARGSRGNGGGFGFGSGGGFGGPGGESFGQRIMRFLNSSYSIGTYLGISVRIHVTFFLMLAIFVLASPSAMISTLLYMLILFLSVLLHEFGHCLACRSVGGQANNILMWPLGGLAYCLPPKRPWPEFVTVICGPLVNLILAAVAIIGIIALSAPVEFGWIQPESLVAASGLDPLQRLLFTLLFVNIILFAFNMALVFYPFDGGRIVQIILWAFLGYERSMRIACRVGMVGAVIIGIAGLAIGHLFLTLIAVFGFMTCYRQNAILKASSYGGYSSAYGGYGQPGPDDRPGLRQRMREKSANKKRQKTAQERQTREAQLNAILDKIQREGMSSLTAREKKFLREASEDRAA